VQVPSELAEGETVRGLPAVPYSTTADGLIAVVKELLRVLTANVLDYSVVEVETVWSTPFSLALPTRAGNISPKIVRAARAVDVANPTTPVYFGATAWSWTGAGVSISDVEGLVAGTTYKLTFEVIG
jgi:hypothetical protein